MSGRLTAAAALTGMVALVPLPASAHLVSTGLGPVYDGIYHFFLSPEEVLPLAALALFAGLRGPPYARWVMFVVPIAWLLAGLIGAEPKAGVQAAGIAIGFLLVGGLLAADVKLSRARTTLFAILLGAICGGMGGSLGSDQSGLLAMLGGALSVAVMLALLSSLALPLRQEWQRLTVRIAGSWIAAVGILLVGWAVHGRS